jgi:hypothetical protein
MAPMGGPARIISVTLLAALAAGGCSATGAGPSRAPAADASAAPSIARPQASPPGRIPGSPAATVVTGEVPDVVIASARSLLAGMVGSDAATAATVVVAQAVTWPDGSLGCREPGVAYEQVEVAGYQVVFDVGGVQYDFRATQAGYVRACTRGGPHSP